MAEIEKSITKKQRNNSMSAKNKQNNKKNNQKENKNLNNNKKVSKKQTVKSSKNSSNSKSHKRVQKKSAELNKQKQKNKKIDKPIKIGFLGGLNEIGKNMTVYEYNNEIIIVDCGLSFPDQDMLGVDLVIPDFTYIKNNIDRVSAIFITHAHEDHIGALPYLLKECNIPVYSAKLTLGIINSKLTEHKLSDKVKLRQMVPGETVKLNNFTVEMIHVNHSIPDACAFAIKTESGTIIQTGDFKIDNTPIDGDVIDLTRFAQIGNEGVLCLLSDSTNAERPGYTESEKIVGESFDKLFRRAGKRRIIIATFASNIHRVQQIMDVASMQGRKVALSGRSLESVIKIGAELGYLNIPEGILINIDQVKNFTDDQMVIITTGSQGEPLSALARMSLGEHRKIHITPNDYIILSAQPIPGNEKLISKLINDLMGLGAEVVYEKMYDVHVSGHACQEEQKLLMGIVKPKYFIPVHGERKHLSKHAMLALNMGIDQNNILIAENGINVSVSEDVFEISERIDAGQVFVDGSGVGDVGNIVLRDRKRLSEDGLIVVAVSISKDFNEIISGPDIVSRGFVYVKESEDLMDQASETAKRIIYNCFDKGINDFNTLKSRVRDEVSRLMFEKTKRSPMILPIFMEV